MSNQFESLPSESLESSLAQVTASELPEADEMADTQTPEEKYADRVAGWRAWKSSMKMLRAIHAEIDGALEAKREVEKFQLADGSVV